MEWADERYVSVFLLTVLNVVQPFFPKPGHVIVDDVIFGDESRISEPGLPLRPIGRVLQYPLKAGHERPLYVVVDLIDQFVGTSECAICIYRGSHETTLNALHGRGVRESSDLYIAEAVQSKAGLPHFNAFPFQNVSVGLSRLGTRNHVAAIVQRVIF